MIKKAYSKINLRLKVLGKDANNYHLLQMVNAKTYLYDTLYFKRIKPHKIIVQQKNLEMEKNTIYKVARIMFEKYQLSGGLMIKVKKKIPYSSGLAGGSVDAATTIKAINEIYRLRLSYEELKEIALLIGTDTVYALHQGICLVEGIGERISVLDCKIAKDILLINPNFEVSTKEIYSLVCEEDYGLPLLKTEIEALDIVTLLDNDLEKVVFNKYPIVLELKQYLQSITKLPILMSGSGPSIYILGDKKELKKILIQVRKQYPTYKQYLTRVKTV